MRCALGVCGAERVVAASSRCTPVVAWAGTRPGCPHPPLLPLSRAAALRPGCLRPWPVAAQVGGYDEAEEAGEEDELEAMFRWGPPRRPGPAAALLRASSSARARIWLPATGTLCLSCRPTPLHMLCPPLQQEKTAWGAERG
jgi:hypothetical protein